MTPVRSSTGPTRRSRRSGTGYFPPIKNRERASSSTRTSHRRSARFSRMRIHALAAPAVLGLIWNCGTSTDPDATPPHDTTGIDGSTKTDGGLVGDDDGAIGDALAPDALSTVCVPNAACSTNAGAPCRTGLVQCGAFGASCADGPAAQDGTMCNAGLCSGGTCRAPTTVDKDI